MNIGMIAISVGSSAVRFVNFQDKVVSIDRYEYGPIDSEAAIANAVANQPVSVAVQSRSRGFQLYRKVRT